MEPNKTILLVEDEAIIAMNEAELLKQQGYEVITAYSAEKAIATVDEHSIDLSLMDIDLGRGKMDGTEAAEIILRKHDIPVVFLSSHTEPEVVEKTENITSYGYIVKNSGDTVLLTSIKMAFRLFEANQHIKKHEKELISEKEKLQHYVGVIEERQRLDNEKQRFLFQLYEKMDLPKEELFDFVLESSIRITGSKYGFSGFINESETVMTIHRWSEGTMEECAVSDKPIEFPIQQSGIWGDCVRERKPVIINDYKNTTGKTKHGTPAGHVEI